LAENEVILAFLPRDVTRYDDHRSTEKEAMSKSPTPTRIGLLLFPGMTQLDFTGPYEVFARLPDSVVHIVAKSLDPVRTDRGLMLIPTVTYRDCPLLDVVVVPGGPGQQPLMEDAAVLDFLRHQAEGAQYVTSVCTGALVLGAAGLLRGYRATTHWLALPLLPLLGAIPVAARIVVDRNRVTGGGVTAGIDFGLKLAALLRGDRVAEQIQLQMEYDPQPPFAAGSPATAPPEIVTEARRAGMRLFEERRATCERVAARLPATPRASSAIAR
jgi:cyclohexyl-isocyanide hydratase